MAINPIVPIKPTPPVQSAATVNTQSAGNNSISSFDSLLQDKIKNDTIGSVEDSGDDL